ncbi:hypothetical protein GFY24_00660 [Nocardia sp. SYP-A9097]|uniref:hypothetical protein n=1 Tax=Nocardia sp. SYP-A9097 TaxID=2663237 RepID=UPI00129BE0E3|nr:hypothetical protein [Nocardia sp. SYP-A9097]MRH85988.1 hypothetical protein [Nocardia sp. SYP-A9097]
MTSPNFPADPALPDKAYLPSTVSQLQDVTAENLAIADNQGTYDQAEDVRAQFFSVIYQQVQQIPIIGGLIGDIIEIITGVEDGDLGDLGTWVNNLGNLINSFIAGALHALADLLEWIPLVGDDMASIIDGIADGMNRTHATATATVHGITGGTDATKVATTVGGIQDNLAANSAAIAALQNQQTGGGVGGTSYTVTFPNTILGNLGPGWTLGGQSTALWATAGAAGLQPDNAHGSGVRWALNTTIMQTDDHEVVMVASTAGYQQAMTSLLVRASTTLSNFVYLNVFQDHAYLGYGAWNGSSYTFHDWADVAINLSTGNTLALTVQGNTYVATINGIGILAHTDTAGQAASGVSYRSVGMLSQQQVDFFGSAWTGWNVKSFSAADVSSPPVIGTGWSIYQSTSSVALPGSGWTTVGANTFDTLRQSAGVTVDLPNGTITITKTGWYMVAFAATLNIYQITAAAGFYYRPSGSSTSSLVRQGVRVDGGGGGDNTATYTVATSNVLYLSAGDKVMPAMYTGTGSGTLTGTGAGGVGYKTYFEGALLNG